MNAAAELKRATTDQGAAVGVIETDLFCDKCGFNLHTQRVWRDERLDILVSRCPECGAHQATGNHTTAGRNWLQRFALMGVVIWALIVFAFVVGVFFLAIACQVAASEGLLYRSLETADGKLVAQTFSNTGVQYFIANDPDSQVAQNEVVNRKRLTPAITGNYPPVSSGPNYYYSSYANWPEIVIVGSLLTMAWLICSALLAAGSWFWRRGRRWYWLLLPVLASTTVYLLMLASTESQRRYGGAVVEDLTVESRIMFVVALLQIMLMATAIQFGRPIIRVLLTVFIPPKTRQLFSFLWHCDGKTMPQARSAGDGLPA